jgi:hypothetical protein
MAIDINIESQVSQTITDGVTNKAPSENAVFDALANKVDKETGKGLSEEDFTMAEKNKLAGIEAGAQVNVNADWNATTGDAEILNKPTIPDVALLVPYTGAVADVDLGTHKLTAKDLVVNHTSGSGDAATITKGGNGEALKVVKSSGSGNAASITGGVTLLDELNLTTKLADAEIASAATWNAKLGGAVSIGQVAFGTAAGVIGGDGGLFWDNVNKRLGVGTSTPAYKVQIEDASQPSLRLIDTTNAAYLDLGIGNFDASISSNGRVFVQSPTTLSVGTTNVGIGIASATLAKFHVVGNVLFSAGNVSLNSTSGNTQIGTTTDAGFRLDVNGTARFGATTVKAQGALSSDIAFRVRNSADTGDLFSVAGNGYIRIGSQATDAFRVYATSTTGDSQPSGLFLTLNSRVDTQTQTSLIGMVTINGVAGSAITGNQNVFVISKGFEPTSGTAIHNSSVISPTINQTGGANGITRGLFVNPTLTAAADFRAIETTNGKVIFGNLPTSSAGLPTGAIWNDAGTLKIV